MPRARIKTYKVDRGGRLTHLQPVSLPFPVMNHDFALTTKHMVFVLDPIVANFRKVLTGRSGFGSSLRWDPSKPTSIVLVPRDGGKPRTIETAPFFHFHVNNAFEDGGDTVVDLVRYDDYSIGENSLTEFRTGGFDEPSALWRLRVKPSGELESHQLCPWSCEFPQHDWRRTTHGPPLRLHGGRQARNVIASGIVKVDHDTDTWTIARLRRGAGRGRADLRPAIARQRRGRRLAADRSSTRRRSTARGWSCSMRVTSRPSRSRSRTCATTFRSASTAR